MTQTYSPRVSLACLPWSTNYKQHHQQQTNKQRTLSLAPDANICLDVRNPTSDYEIREKVVINPREYEEPEENSKQPPYHFGIRWEGSKKRSVLTVLDADALGSALKKKAGKKGKKGGSGPFAPRSMCGEDSEKYVPVLALDCRGIEPYAFHPMGSEFIVESEGGMMFEEDVDLREGDWAEYDDENDIAVGITDFESKIEDV